VRLLIQDLLRLCFNPGVENSTNGAIAPTNGAFCGPHAASTAARSEEPSRPDDLGRALGRVRPRASAPRLGQAGRAGAWTIGLALLVTPLIGGVDARGAPETIVRALLAGTNQARGERGLGPLRLSGELGAAARAHAEDLLAHGYFEHRSRDGSEPVDRVRRFAPRAIAIEIRENLFEIEDTNPPDAAARAASAIEGWLDSKGHRENLLAADVTDVGFGVAGRWIGATFHEVTVQVLGIVAGRWERPPPPTVRPLDVWRAELRVPLEFFLEDLSRPGHPYPDSRDRGRIWRGGLPLAVTGARRSARVGFPKLDAGSYQLLVRRPGEEGYQALLVVVVEPEPPAKGRIR
jgi:uncharacterized protein YkwD